MASHLNLLSQISTKYYLELLSGSRDPVVTNVWVLLLAIPSTIWIWLLVTYVGLLAGR
jgi:hypothetical protein